MSEKRDKSKDLCRCGVYRYVHDEGRACGRFRHSYGIRLWLMNHNPAWHITGWMWLNLRNDRSRMAAADRYYAAHPELCWCDMVDAVLLDDKKSDYRTPDGCGCDVPRIGQARIPNGGCYCDYREAA